MSQARIDELDPCPFCGAGTFEIRPNGQMWTGQKLSDPVSVSVLHWCAPVTGQPARVIERVGKDEDSAIAAWNQRAISADGLRQVQEWAKAYPLEMFSEMSPEEWARAKDVLAGAGLSLDRISASNMRHVITKVNGLLKGAS